MSWVELNTVLIYTSEDFAYSQSVAGCGFQNTICKNAGEWDFWTPKILEKFRLIHEKGGSLVFFSNQVNENIHSLKARFTRFIPKLTLEDDNPVIDGQDKPKNIPIMALFATKKNCFRKPFTNLWKVLGFIYIKKGLPSPDSSMSIYIGGRDGALYLSNWKECEKIKYTKKIFKNKSDNDRAFAKNIGVAFVSSKKFFLEKPESKWIWCRCLLSVKDRITYLRKHENDSEPDIVNILDEMNGEKHLILINGNYSAGKNTLAKIIIKNLKESHGDEFKVSLLSDQGLRFSKKINKKFTDALFDGTTIIVTYNPTYKARKRYLQFAKKYDMSVLIINMTTDPKICEILNHTKLQTSKNFQLDLHPHNYYKKWLQQQEYPDYAENYIKVIDYPMVLRFRKELKFQYSIF